MSRRNASKTKRINISVTEQIASRLESLAAEGLYGANPSEVAKYIVQAGIIDLENRGKFKS